MEDLEGTETQQKVAEFLRAVHEPAFGRPHSIREPHVTRAGDRAVVTGGVFDELSGVARTAVYTAEGGEFRAVVTGPGSSRCGRFSPDGGTLAFLSDRRKAGVFQLYLLDVGGFGEARPAPEVPGTVEYLHWSPDGSKVLLGVAGLGADLSGGQGSGTNVRQSEEKPSWYPKLDDGTQDGGWRSLWVCTVATGEPAQVSPAGMNCWEAGWCGPDQVVAIASDAPGEDEWYTARLSLIDLEGGARKLLGSDVQLALPAGSPDGARVAVVEAVCSDRGLVAGDLPARRPGDRRRAADRHAGHRRHGCGVGRRGPPRLRRAAPARFGGRGCRSRRRRARRAVFARPVLLRWRVPAPGRVHRGRPRPDRAGLLRAGAGAGAERIARGADARVGGTPGDGVPAFGRRHAPRS